MHTRLSTILALALASAGAAHADIWQIGDLTTYTQASWGGDPSLPDPGAALLVASYDTVFSSTFGIVTVGSASGFTMSFTDAASMLAYMPSIGPFAPLIGSSLNPISTASGGLGGEVLGLELNIDFSDRGLLPGATGLRFGDLVLENFSTPAFNGLTVRQFRGDLNTLLGGGSSIFSIADLGTTVQDVNASFGNGTPTAFAQAHLVAPAPVSTVPEPSSRPLLITSVLALVSCSLRRSRRAQKRSL